MFFDLADSSLDITYIPCISVIPNLSTLTPLMQSPYFFAA